MAKRKAEKNTSAFYCNNCRSFTFVDYGNNWCNRCKQWNSGYGIKDPVWVCDDRTPIHISKMETSHIQACMGMILSRSNWRNRFMEPLLKELKKRKEADKDVDVQSVERTDPPG